MLKSIKHLEDVSSNVIPRGQLKAGKKTKGNVDTSNIVAGKRKRVRLKELTASEKQPKKKAKEKVERTRFGLKRGDAVSVAPGLSCTSDL